jgi:hypothetical protein
MERHQQQMKISSDLGNRHPVTIDQLVMPAIDPSPFQLSGGYNKAPMTYDHAWFCY